jgi:hypothetical protein
MNNLERSNLALGGSDSSQLAYPRKSHKLTVMLFAAFAGSALIGWLLFLGWGLFTFLRWLGGPR